MRTEVEFKYSIDEGIITPFGSSGIIEMLGFDDGGIKYYVKTSKGGSWHKEKELRAK